GTLPTIRVCPAKANTARPSAGERAASLSSSDRIRPAVAWPSVSVTTFASGNPYATRAFCRLIASVTAPWSAECPGAWLTPITSADRFSGAGGGRIGGSEATAVGRGRGPHG